METERRRGEKGVRGKKKIGAWGGKTRGGGKERNEVKEAKQQRHKLKETKGR